MLRGCGYEENGCIDIGDVHKPFYGGNSEPAIAFMQGGERLLQRLSDIGKPITRIVTSGYLGFWLYSSDGENMYFDLTDGTAEVSGFSKHNWCTGYELTDELLTGADYNVLTCLAE